MAAEISDGAAAWVVKAGSDYRIRSWDGEFVVYCDITGDTHEVAPIGGLILLLLAQSALTVEHLAGDIAEELDIDVSQQFIHKISTAVTRLQSLELVETVPA